MDFLATLYIPRTNSYSLESQQYLNKIKILNTRQRSKIKAQQTQQTISRKRRKVVILVRALLTRKGMWKLSEVLVFFIHLASGSETYQSIHSSIH